MTAQDSASTFRSRFNQVVAIVVWVLCTGGAVAAVVSGTPKDLGYLALVSFLTWMALWRVAVRVDDEGVTLVNVFSTVTVPWEGLINVETRFALTLHTAHGKFTATAAPAPSKLSTAIGPRDAAGLSPALTAGGRVRPSDLPSTDSGAAAYLVRERWSFLVESGRIELGIAESIRVRREWHRTSVIVCVVLAAASITVLLVH
jgi:hypothetical protein